MDRCASILDYQQNTLSIDIWDNYKLKVGIRQYIYTALEGFFEFNDINNCGSFVDDIFIGSSLATYFYKNDSDLDIKVIINIKKFKEHNQKFSHLSVDSLLDYLVDLGRESTWLTAMIPGTQHPLDVYFISTAEAKSMSLLKYDSLYDVFKDLWIKEPKKLDPSLSVSYVLNYAKDMAQEFLNKLSLDIAVTKRDSVDFLVLRDYIKTLDSDDLGVLYTDFKTALQRVNADVKLLMQDRDLIKGLRKNSFHRKDLKTNLEYLMGSLNYADDNLLFKLVQRYGYMRILSEVKLLMKDGKITSDEVEDLIDILG